MMARQFSEYVDILFFNLSKAVEIWRAAQMSMSNPDSFFIANITSFSWRIISCFNFSADSLALSHLVASF